MMFPRNSQPNLWAIVAAIGCDRDFSAFNEHASSVADSVRVPTRVVARSCFPRGCCEICGQVNVKFNRGKSFGWRCAAHIGKPLREGLRDDG